MNKKILIVLVLAMIFGGSASFAATPEKPYSDLAPREVLTSQWLMGMFNTIYTWAQTANTDIATLKGGALPSGEYSASGTSSIATTTFLLTFDSTGLTALSAPGSGTIGIVAYVQACDATGTMFAAFKFETAYTTNGTYTDIIGSIAKTTSLTVDAASFPIDVNISTGSANISLVASTTAGIKWGAWVIQRLTAY